MAPWRAAALVALGLLLPGPPGSLRVASAQDGVDVNEADKVPEAGGAGKEAASEEAEDAEVVGDEAEDGEEAASEPGNVMDSAKELQDKLGQLKALLAKKGDSVDPELKERLQGLEQQLDSLNLDGLTGLAGGAGSGSKELQEFLGGCIMMSLRRAGARRPQTLGALRRLAKGVTQEEGADVELVRMVAVCVNELTDVELGQFRAGQLQILPQHLTAQAAQPSGRDAVLGIEATVWEQLGPVAAAMQEQLVGDVDANKLPGSTALIAGVPLLLIFAFLGKKFFEMKQREVHKKDKGKKKTKDK